MVIAINDLPGCDLDFGGPYPFSFVIVVASDPLSHGLDF